MFSFQKYSVLLCIFLTIIVCQSSVYENCNLISPPNSLDPIPSYPIDIKETITIIELESSTDAKCLDGTNAKFNLSLGTGSGKNKFMFFFLGGGFCGVEEVDIALSCLQRSTTILGTSKFLPENNTIFKEQLPLGYFSSSRKYNPKFWNWNKIGINYCDGTMHQGYSKDPIIINETKLWFRGNNITMGVIEWTRQHLNLFEAEEIIIAGGSAGGHAVFIWAPFLQEYFPKQIKLSGITDAGYFLDIYNVYAKCNLFGYLIQQVAMITKTGENDIVRKCKFYGTEEVWKCLIPQYIVDDIKIPLFIANSQNDFMALLTHYGIICLADGSSTCSVNDRQLIYQFREEFLKQMLNIKKNHPKWGFWLRSCIEHYYYLNGGWYSDNFLVFNAEINKSKRLRDALYDWYEGLDNDNVLSNSFIDLIGWEKSCPDNFLKID